MTMRLGHWGCGGLIASVLLCGSCSVTKDNAICVTKTSFSLLDVDTTPGGVSVAYDRVEGYAGPHFVCGKVFAVASYIAVPGQGLTCEV